MKDIKLTFRKSSLFHYVLALFLIVTGSTFWCTLTPSVLTGAAAMVILYSLCVFYVLKNKKISYQGLQTSVFMLIYLTIYMIGARQGKDRTISFITQMVVPFVIYPVFCSTLIHNNECKKLLKAFADIMIFLSVISVFCWVFGTILDVLPFRRQVTYIWAGGRRRTAYTYFNLYYETNLQLLNTQLVNFGRLNRNVGIFCEAPGYAFCLDMALAIELLTTQKIDRKRVAILVITGITTFSVKAYIFMAMAFYLRMAFLSKTKKRTKLATLYTFMPIILVAVLVFSFILVRDKVGDPTKDVRVDDLQAGLAAWRDNPIWGCGFFNNDAILAYAKVKRNNPGLSMGTAFLANGGLYMTALYLGALIAVFTCKMFKLYKRELIVFTILILFHFFNGNLGTRQSSLFMVSLGYTYFMLEHQKRPVIMPDVSYRSATEREHRIE